MAETLDDIRKQIGKWLSGPHGAALAAILAAQRGPDSPSERGDMDRAEYDRRYLGRRARKRSSGEVIRAASFFGIGHVGCRVRKDTKIVLPPRNVWDHYDKHQAEAAHYLGIEVVIDEKAPSAKEDSWR